MNKLLILESDSFYPHYNQALEKYLLERTGKNEVTLFLWQNEKTVFIDRNQDAYSECDTEKLESDGGYLARRITGGGAVYHDRGNLNVSFICHKDIYDSAAQADIILKALERLGIEAERNGRNDLLVRGRKFSGHAFYKGKENCLHHCTLMIDVSEDDLAGYLKVSAVKLSAKNVASVRSRVINLKEVKEDISVDSLKKALILAAEEHYDCLSVPYAIEDPGYVKGLEKDFSDPVWCYGKNGPASYTGEKRINGTTLRVAFEMDGDTISRLSLYSDALDIDAYKGVDKKLAGRTLSELRNIEDRELKEIAGLILEVCNEI